MSVVFTALAAMLTGFLIGGAARFAVPGPDPMPFWLTVLIGLIGSAIGTAIGAALFGAKHTFDSSAHSFATLLLAIGFATGLVAAYRILVQKRPLTGPGRPPVPAQRHRHRAACASSSTSSGSTRTRSHRRRQAGAAGRADARRRPRPAREAP